MINSLLLLVLHKHCIHSTYSMLGLSAWIWWPSDCVIQRHLYAFYNSSVGIPQIFSRLYRSFQAESLQFAERRACYGNSSIACPCWSHSACSPLDLSLSKIRSRVADSVVSRSSTLIFRTSCYFKTGTTVSNNLGFKTRQFSSWVA